MPSNTLSKTLKILILTDSLGLPGDRESYAMSYEETYVSMLKNKYPFIDFIHYGQGGANIKTIQRASVYYKSSEPFLAIVQCGIVDCAPRALKPIEKSIINRLPFNKFLINQIKKNSVTLRKYRNINITSLDTYKKNVDILENTFKDLLWIQIIRAPDFYEKKVPNINKNIEMYNKVLKERKSIDTSKYDDSFLISDGHHLSPKGHEKIFRDLSNVIDNKLNKLGSKN